MATQESFMDPQPHTIFFLPPWPLDDLLAYISNPDDLAGLTENFSSNERFCTRVPQQQASMSTIYGHDQYVFNQQSAAICQALLQILANINNNPQDLPTAFAPCWEELLAARKDGRHALNTDDIQNTILACVGTTPVEKFFAYIAYFRHLLAAAAPMREETWHNFGANRYLDGGAEDNECFDTPLDTPLEPDRYQPSVDRGKDGAARQDYLADIREKLVSGLRQALENHKLSQREFEEKIRAQEEKNRALTSFDIAKVFGGQKVLFARISKWTKLLNLRVPEETYINIYDYMNNLFETFFTPQLMPAQKWLETIFRIQFWFIHIMPYRRGSLAVMNMFRYAMTAYYNYRALKLGRAPLPIAPARIGYFPDLEALLCCRTEGDFTIGSCTTYYCVDFSRHA